MKKIKLSNVVINQLGDKLRALHVEHNGQFWNYKGFASCGRVPAEFLNYSRKRYIFAGWSYPSAATPESELVQDCFYMAFNDNREYIYVKTLNEAGKVSEVFRYEITDNLLVKDLLKSFI